MRFTFKSDAKPSHLAKKLQTLLVKTQGNPVGLVWCQETIAIANGYKNWQELKKVCIKTSKGLESKQEDQNLQKNALSRTLSKSLGLNWEQAQTISIGVYEASKPQQIKNTQEIWVMQWEEREAGWGIRPDGYSIHDTLENYTAYFNKVRDYLIETYGDKIPYEYSIPTWDQPVKITVNQVDHAELINMASGGTAHIYSNKRELLKTLEELVRSQNGSLQGWNIIK